MPRYRVMVDENFHAGSNDDRSEHGIYAAAADAIEACQTIVDDSLLWEYEQCATAEGGPTGQQLYDRFADFGDSPFVVALEGAPKVDFAIRTYARKRAEELAAPGEASVLLRRTLQERKDHRISERMKVRNLEPEKEPGPEKETTPEKEQLSAAEIREESSPIARE